MADPYPLMLKALREGTLKPEKFSHRHHVGVAVEILQKYPFFEALWIMADGLQQLATRASFPEKFNATITFASMSLIAERLAQTPHLSTEEFMEVHPELLSLHLIQSLYSTDRLKTSLAHKVGLLPMN